MLATPSIRPSSSSKDSALIAKPLKFAMSRILDAGNRFQHFKTAVCSEASGKEHF